MPKSRQKVSDFCFVFSVLLPPCYQDAVALAETLLYEDAEVEALSTEGCLGSRAFLG